MRLAEQEFWDVKDVNPVLNLLFSAWLSQSNLRAHWWRNAEGRCGAHTHAHTREDYAAVKQDDILPLWTTWMDPESSVQREVSQTDKDKHPMIALICGIYKTRQTNEQTQSRIRPINTEKKLMVSRGRGGWEVGKMDEGLGETHF